MEHASKEIEKEKIRNRYKGVSPDLLEVIPAEERVDILQDDREKRVGVYVRVSTDDPRQTSSFELQRNHYTDLIDRYPNWHLYRIYADEGISGTSLKHRKSFIKMIEDCKQHKLDLIVTKSVSRFARNIYDCIGYIRMLAALKPPVGVFFETEGLYTLRDDSEMALTFTASFAQEESRTRSSAMNLSYEMRFRRGIFMLPKLLGYDKDEEGNLVVNENEAQTVRLIFFMFLYGYTPQEIADELTKLQLKTKKGKRLKYPLRWDSLAKNLEKKSEPSTEESPAYVEEDGYIVDPATGEIIQEPEEDEDDFYGDEEGAPDNIGALPSPDLLDNLALRQP